jgi:hypothetical protein
MVLVSVVMAFTVAAFVHQIRLARGSARSGLLEFPRPGAIPFLADTVRRIDHTAITCVDIVPN